MLSDHIVPKLCAFRSKSVSIKIRMSSDYNAMVWVLVDYSICPVDNLRFIRIILQTENHKFHSSGIEGVKCIVVCIVERAAESLLILVPAKREIFIKIIRRPVVVTC